MEYFNTNKMSDLTKRGILLSRNSDKNIDRFIQNIVKVRTTKNGIFGIKIHVQQWRDLWLLNNVNKYRDKDFYTKKIQQSFVNPHIIFLYRDDLVSQAISMHIAIETESWSSDVKEKESAKYSFAKIYSVFVLVNDQARRCRVIQSTFNGPQMTMKYENLINDYEGCVHSISKFIGEDVDMRPYVTKENITKQGTERNIRWKKRFIKELKTLQNQI
jgi:LPS sulfotransferase NodH